MCQPTRQTMFTYISLYVYQTDNKNKSNAHKECMLSGLVGFCAYGVMLHSKLLLNELSLSGPGPVHRCLYSDNVCDEQLPV